MTNDSGHPWHCFGKEIRDKYGGLRIGLVILIDQPECDFLPPMRTSRRLASVIASLRGIASAAGVGFFDRTGKADQDLLFLRPRCRQQRQQR